MAGARRTQPPQGLGGFNARKTWGLVVVYQLHELGDAFRAPSHTHFVDRERANHGVKKIVERHQQAGALLSGNGRELADSAIMCRARPLFKTAREKLFYGVRIELTEKAD